MRPWRAACVLSLLLLAPISSDGTAAGVGAWPPSLAALRSNAFAPPGYDIPFPTTFGHSPPQAGAMQPVAQAPGCTLYVSTTGSDSNDGRSETSAFRTIQSAADAVQPGDVVCVKAGTYAGFHVSKKHGTAQNPIVFRSYPRHTAVLDGMLGGYYSAHMIYVEEGEYVVIDGFEITDNTSSYSDPKLQLHGINVNDWPTASHHVRIIDNKIHRFTGGGIGSGYTTHHNEFINNEIYDVGSAKVAYGMYIGGDDHILRGNIIHDAYGHGITLYGGDPERNLIENNILYSNGRDDYAKGWDWRNCKENGCLYGDGIVAWGGSGNIVRNNISYTNRMAGITVHSQNSVVVNNTAYNNRGPGSESPGIWVTENKNSTVRNNASYQNAGGDYYIGPGNTQDHNLFGVDPKFANPAQGDFHLTASSPAIDVGSPQDTPSTDLEGVRRPQGAGYDIGAYEFQQGDAPTFADVPSTYWAYPYVEALFQGGYVAGCSDSPRRFCPDDGLSRAEAAVFVERGVHGGGFLPPEPGSSAFSDVALGNWYVKWVHQLWLDGSTVGCAVDPLLFCPLQVHTRAEGAVFFVRMLRGKDYLPPEPTRIPYQDVAHGTWYLKWVAAADAEGLTRDCEDPSQRTDQNYRPSEPLTRAEAACMMARAKGLPAPQE
ncbi:MAG TPA: right-handed parallel beta-helix repeat-containing protein [Anaerolineales bacterium]|nr:right-handed parallel beta-helix repeat-containing protein [Anaerolineales bacterium]